VNRNRIVNRPIEPSWMDAAMDVASSGGIGKDGRDRLDIRLRDSGLTDEARRKSVETIHPVWINPPRDTRDFITWAVERSSEVAEMRPVHLIALAATYPFFGDASAIIGRLLRSGYVIDAADVRRHLKARWGDRDAINVAVRKVIQTMRSFGVLAGGRGSAVSHQAERFPITGEWALWTAVALLLTRDAEMTNPLTVESAPEFFYLDLLLPAAGVHPLLEPMRSGDGRMTFALRRSRA
jgi:hypothetical protein